MKRSDFIEIRKEHFDTCRQLIELEGACGLIDCAVCPFTYDNATNHGVCDLNGYRNHVANTQDSLCKEKAEEFRRLFKRITSPYLVCKHCGGYIKYIKNKESYLDRDGHAIDSDVDEVQYYQCDSCKRKAHTVADLADIEEEEL